jgi:L-aminopeptidase/D-esterase-like protein
MLLAATSTAILGELRAGETEDDTSICDVGGLQIGHFTDARRPTGCTVILMDHPATAGVDVRGSAPGTRETDLLNPVNSVQAVNAILLSGGSAFGLDAATGVMRYLEENKRGLSFGGMTIPIVPAAILFDLNVGDGKIRPDAQAGYEACVRASCGRVAEGCVGAGAGATVGKLFGMASAMKSGIGTASITIGKSGFIVGAIVAVNAVGDVISRESGRILAGARNRDSSAFADTMQQLMAGVKPGSHGDAGHAGTNSTIGVVATNATLTKAQAEKLAQMAHDGLARVINPIHTGWDGDTIFAAATGSVTAPADISILGAVGAEVMARAVNRAVLKASGLPNLPARADLDWARNSGRS